MDKYDRLKEVIKDKYNRCGWKNSRTPGYLSRSICEQAGKLIANYVRDYNEDDEYYLDEEYVQQPLVEIFEYCLEMAMYFRVDLADIVINKHEEYLKERQERFEELIKNRSVGIKHTSTGKYKALTDYIEILSKAVLKDFPSEEEEKDYWNNLLDNYNKVLGKYIEELYNNDKDWNKGKKDAFEYNNLINPYDYTDLDALSSLSYLSFTLDVMFKGSLEKEIINGKVVNLLKVLTRY